MSYSWMRVISKQQTIYVRIISGVLRLVYAGSSTEAFVSL